MDFNQFIIMFKSIYLEGFARPYEGVQQIIRVLLKKYKNEGGERRMNCGVKKLHVQKDSVSSILLDNDEEITANYVISSAGIVETLRLCDNKPPKIAEDNIGRLSFVEIINVMDKQPVDLGWDDTIVFFNNSERFSYACPDGLVDSGSGVICMPNNYQYSDGAQLKEGFLRVTAIANFDKWVELAEPQYREAKDEWYDVIIKGALDVLPDVDRDAFKSSTVAKDMFTPRTIKKFTGHLGGAVYGAPVKQRDGSTNLKNLFVCGTDQGFLGIVGAMLSGISMANYHILGRS